MTIQLNVQGSFYPRFKAANPTYSTDTFRCAEETVSELINRATTSEHPGMLLGKVQSGKTRTFISILALAFDNAFDIAIVLSKNSIALIEQTTNRLNQEFKIFVDDGDFSIYDILNSPDSFDTYELNNTRLIFVAKKQSDNLVRLIKLFQDPAMKAKRTLIIDDEADNASIGYEKDKKGVLTARKIAKQISDLRSAIDNSSFLQVTATPYSLYLQPSEIELSGDMSFRPIRPAFTKLVPVPPDYVGGETYFGELARNAGSLESLLHYDVDAQELERLKKQDGRSFKIAEVLTAPQIVGYRTAIVTALTGCCIMRINGISAGKHPQKLHYCLVVHTETPIKAHTWQEKLTVKIIEKLADAARDNDPIFTKLITEAVEDLSRSLTLDKQPIPPLHAILEAASGGLAESYVKVIVVNSENQVAAMLDTAGQLKLPTPLTIFLGGQVLDRGVTLRNLIGFYYGRRPNRSQQDTVMQHSRMYGYRRSELAVTRFYTSARLRHTMSQMEEFDSALRQAIEAGGDGAVQFIRKAKDNSIIPCSPNKILISSIQTLRPHKRILPIGFQTGYAGGAKGIGGAIAAIDARINSLCEFSAAIPVLIPLATALDLLKQIQPTLHFPEDNAPPFDWESAKAALTHLSHQHPDANKRGSVLLWAAQNRKSARLAGPGSHATYIETPDSPRTEGKIAKAHAIDHPILFLLRQNGEEVDGWRGTPFYWPIIRAQSNTPTAIYTAEAID